jgi:ribosomal protein S18 acetylase RimI-like enzyme
MATRLNAVPAIPPEIVDLRRVSSRDLEPLLREEIAVWRNELDWDFENSANLVRRFVDAHSLNGGALVVDGQLAGYLYYVVEDHKGLIGDLYLLRRFRSTAYEDMLLASGVSGIRQHPEVTRIESQLLMLQHIPSRPIPCPQYAVNRDRNFMRVKLGTAVLAEGRVRRPMYIENWADHYQDAAAQIIADAYSGHVDSLINDQYRSVAGARRFLFNIVQFPGCGTFFRPASSIAFDAVSGQPCGISLASLVAPESGHITQICVSPSVRGTGIGHALLRRSLLTLREMGCHTASLTVTAANENAVALYERVGFRTIRKFSAYAWEGF